jgi:hypothetical protein
LLTACSAFALAACGGEGTTVEERANPGPPIERGTAEQLAVRSDEVARLLEAGDNCGAMAEGARLRDELNTAIARGVIPEIYLEDLSGLVNEIQAQIPPCEDVVQVPPPPRDRNGRGEDKKRDKKEDKKKKDEGDD